MHNEQHQTTATATDADTGPTPSGEPMALSIKRGYEVGDVRLKWAVWVAAIFTVGIVVILIFLWFLWKLELRRHAADDQARSIVTDNQDFNVAAPPLQPNTRHDTSPSEDLKIMHHREDAVFNAVGWKVSGGSNLPAIPDDVVAKVAARKK